MASDNAMSAVEAAAIEAAARVVRAKKPADEAVLVLILTRDRACFKYDVPPRPAESDGLFDRPSGPSAPDLFVWRGRSAKLTRREFALLDRLWAARTASAEEVVEWVWGVGAEAGDANLRSLVYRVNKKIAAAGCALSVTQEQGFFVLG